MKMKLYARLINMQHIQVSALCSIQYFFSYLPKSIAQFFFSYRIYQKYHTIF